MTRLVRLLLAAGVLVGDAAADHHPARLELPRSVGERMAAAAARALMIEPHAAPEALPDGTIKLSERVHLVPIHLYPVKAGLHETLALVIDGQRGARPLRLEVAGTGLLGGAEGEANVTRGNTVHGTVINSPALFLSAVEDTQTVFQVRVHRDRVLSAQVRAGSQVWEIPYLMIMQAYFQTGARIDGFVRGEKVHFETFAGTGPVATLPLLPGLQTKITPGLEVSASFTLER